MDKAIKYIDELDLFYIEERLVTNGNWKRDEAQDAIRRYKNSLKLMVKYPDIGFVPTHDIDEVWHAHILHTKDYFKDCEAIFGKYRHHSPITPKTTKAHLEKMGDMYHEFSKKYEEEYQEQYSQMFDISRFWND